MSGLAYAMLGCENNEKRRISFHLRVIFCYGSSFEQGGLDHAGDGRDYFFGRLLGQESVDRLGWHETVEQDIACEVIALSQGVRHQVSDGQFNAAIGIFVP